MLSDQERLELKLSIIEMQRRLAIRSLYEFTQQCWPILEPRRRFVPGWHLEAICEHLEATVTGDIKNLIINVPPRHMKSIECAVCFPAWIWLRYPEKRFLCASYAQHLSKRDSIKCRRLIESEWYRQTFKPDWQLAGDQNEKMRFENTEQGARIATSVGGTGTGEGGDFILCLPYDTLIQTEVGNLPIGFIVNEQLPVRVFSYCHDAESYVLGEIDQYETNGVREVIKIELSNGKEIELTPEHPIFIEKKGYVQAQLLEINDEVLVGDYYEMQKLRYQIPVQKTKHWKTGALLFRGMSSTAYEGGSSSQMEGDFSVMRNLWKRDSENTELDYQNEFLFEKMSINSSAKTNCWPKEWPLQERKRSVSVQNCRIPRNEKDYFSKGSAYLSSLRQCESEKKLGHSSYRWRQKEQSITESNLSLQCLPQTNSCKRIYIRAIKKTGKRVPVFNLQIKNYRNYFAENILVHNCDDPHKATEIHSKTIRQGVLDWWDQEMSTRGNDAKTVVKIIIMQRLHTEDLAGHLLAQGGWEHLRLPAEYDGRHYVTAIGWQDPRKTEGELLWPERFGQRQIDESKKALGSLGASGQLQQNPAPIGGHIIKREWLKFYKKLPARFDEMALTWDLGVKGGEENDPTCGQVWGRVAGNYYLVDQVRDQMVFSAAVMSIKMQSSKWPQAYLKLVEERANGTALIQHLQNQIPGLVGFNPKTSKAERLIATQPLFEAGNVWYPDISIAPWVHVNIEELVGFPTEKHDDTVDATTQLLLRWQTGATGVFKEDYVQTGTTIAGGLGDSW